MSKITTRAEDFPQWYQDVIEAADLAEHSPVRGSMIIKPSGYALWERIQSILDTQFKKVGVKNAYFPLLIPESFFAKEAEHVEGFAPELAMVTHAGGEKLKEPYAVRPTSETIIYDAFSRWVQSYRDLPMVLNQWCNVMRWELRPRLFLRTTEFLWQEGHTVHATPQEARERTHMMHTIYADFFDEYCAMPSIMGRKTENEKFPGAEQTFTVESMMQDGKALQACTSHYFGNGFAKNFDVKFVNKQNELEYGYTTSWGLTTRSIGGLIMAHADDAGLVLPPKIAPTQVILLPLVFGKKDQEVMACAGDIQSQLDQVSIRTDMDTSDKRPGEKAFLWEKRGVPVRIEIGPRDLDLDQVVVVRRDTGQKTPVQRSELTQYITSLLDEIQQELRNRYLNLRESHTVTVNSWQEFESAIETGNFVMAHWDGTITTEEKIKQLTKATIRCIPLDSKPEDGICVLTGQKSERRVLFARAY